MSFVFEFFNFFKKIFSITSSTGNGYAFYFNG